MMLLLHLIRKDILLAKSSILITAIMVVAIPLFFLVTMPVSGGLIPFLYMVVLTEIILLQAVSALEAKSPKAFALLCTAPYTRRTLVAAKYLFFAVLFAFCYCVHTLCALIADRSSILDLTSVLTVLLLSTIVYGIYMPVEFKYGNAKAKFIFTTLVLVLSFAPIVFMDFLGGVDFTMIVSSIAAIPGFAKCIALALLSIFTYALSMEMSMRIFSRKEL